jgi:hypothetical protein
MREPNAMIETLGFAVAIILLVLGIEYARKKGWWQP